MEIVMSLSLKGSHQTEIYLSDAGYFVINQPENPLGGTVQLSPHQAEALKHYIADFLDDAHEAFDSLGEE